MTEYKVVFTAPENEPIINIETIADCIIIATVSAIYVRGDKDSDTYKRLTKESNNGD